MHEDLWTPSINIIIIIIIIIIIGSAKKGSLRREKSAKEGKPIPLLFPFVHIPHPYRRPLRRLKKG